MRILIAAASCILLAACSSSDSQPDAAAQSPTEPISPTASSSSSTASDDPCNLLSPSDLEGLVGDRVGEPAPGLTGGLANCQWASPSGAYVQTISASSSDWAQSLPEALRAIESAGHFEDTESLQKLRKGAALVEAGTDLSPSEACGLFSDMVELQGQPAGTQWIVNLVPDRDDPMAITGQMCSGGRFTSVMVANEAGLDARLPVKQVVKTLRSAHRQSLAGA